ncbi:hypothetical protein Bca52824_076734 [Brassica carinata]|uniref:Uncharacterized protein n=1 Tax=Brassica carinata TaxID=52824 RepID=A0A8X7PUF9_BRACI|nr:hypothetical protein Bca52824_076734 [Brassica carinata]
MVVSGLLSSEKLEKVVEIKSEERTWRGCCECGVESGGRMIPDRHFVRYKPISVCLCTWMRVRASPLLRDCEDPLWCQ